MSTLSFFNEARPSYNRSRTFDGSGPSGLKRVPLSRNVSFMSNAQLGTAFDVPVPEPKPPTKEKLWQHVDRHAQNVDPNIEPSLPIMTKSKQTPIAIYDEAFASLLGRHPVIDNLITDARSPYFYAGGAWIPRHSTLFLTSNLIHDADPAAVSSANQRTEITKIEFYASGEFTRDKVRCPERSYMAAGCAPYPDGNPSGVVVCAQGSLKEPAGLVQIDIRRPHKARMILNNFHGRPFNSPCDIIANLADNSLYFTDPAYGFERGFRPKPQLPTGHVYRFDPKSGDCRVIVSGLSRPAGLAFSPDYSVLYVSELNDKYGGTYIHAYDIVYSTVVPSAPSFHISVVPNGVNGKTGRHNPTLSSSSDSSNDSHHATNSKFTPTSSPRGLAAAVNLVERKVSRSNSHSGIRDQDSPHQKHLQELSLGGNSPSRGPTSNPAPQPPATAFSSSYRSSGRFLINRRLFAYSPNVAPSGGIATDPIQGNIWLGTEEGVEVWGAKSGELVGKVLVDEWDGPPNDRTSSAHKGKRMKGVSKVAFGNDGEALLFGGERIWRLTMGPRGVMDGF